MISAGSGRHSSAAMQQGGASASVTRALSPASTTVIVGCAISPGGMVATATMVTIKSGGTYQLTLGFNASGFITVWRDHPQVSGVLLGTATTGALVSGTYAYIELKTTIHPSAGTAVVRVNGTVVLSLSGVNTASSGSAAWDSVGFFCANGTQYYDDLYVLDGSGSAPWNDFLGDCRVDVRNPTGAGAVTGWTPSTGANWQNVDDAAPNDDTDYNAAASASLTDTFVVQDAAVAGAVLYGVQVSLSAKKSDSGTCSLASVVRQSGSNQVATAQNPSTSYAYLTTLYQTNPHTAAQWTESDFNADEFGYSRTA